MIPRVQLLALLLVPSVLLGQDLRPDIDTARAERLRRQIEQRFSTYVRSELDLSEEQMSQLHATNEKYFAQRRDLALRQRDLRRALQLQMRPGVAANADSVGQLNEALRENRARLFELEQAQEQEMSAYLTPVQMARYRMLRERFMERVNQLRRRGTGGPGAPGGPGMRGQRPPDGQGGRRP